MAHLGTIWGAIWAASGGDLGHLGAIWGSCGKLKKAYKTSVKHTILNLGYALLSHHDAPKIHKPHERHLEGSREHLGASCGPPWSHLGVLWELPAASWELYALASNDFRRTIQ